MLKVCSLVRSVGNKFQTGSSQFRMENCQILWCLCCHVYFSLNREEGFLLSKLAHPQDVNLTHVRYVNKTWCGPLTIVSGFSPFQDFLSQIRSDNSIAGDVMDVICSPILIITVLFILV